MFVEVRNDVTDHLVKTISLDYCKRLPDEFIEEIVDDVIETSDYLNNGKYNDADIRYAFGRVLLKWLGIKEQ